MDYDRLLNLTTDLGYQLMASGAEIYRVEESMHRVLKAYGLERPEVFAIPNCIIVSVTTPQGHPITRMRRIPGPWGQTLNCWSGATTCAGIYAARSHHWRMPRAWSPPWREGIPATRPIRY